MILRETDNIRAEEVPGNKVRLVAKGNVLPGQRTVRRVEDYDNYLARLNDPSFNAACVLDFGIGLWTKERRR